MAATRRAGMAMTFGFFDVRSPPHGSGKAFRLETDADRWSGGRLRRGPSVNRVEEELFVRRKNPSLIEVPLGVRAIPCAKSGEYIRTGVG